MGNLNIFLDRFMSQLFSVWNQTIFRC